MLQLTHQLTVQQSQDTHLLCPASSGSGLGFAVHPPAVALAQLCWVVVLPVHITTHTEKQ